MNRIPIFVCLCLLSACASQNPNKQASPTSSSVKPEPQVYAASDYATELQYPEQINVLQFVSQHEYEDPMHGIQLRYAHTVYTDDIIDLYVYPIPAVDLTVSESLLKVEVERVTEEVNEAVRAGYYAGYELQSNRPVKLGEKAGRKAEMNLESKQGDQYLSLVYLFIQQDKFIKVRYSLLKDDESGFPNPDNVVNDLVSQIIVPGESDYMRQLRKKEAERQKEAMATALMEALLKAQNETQQSKQQDDN